MITTDEAYEVLDVVVYNTDERMHGPPKKNTGYYGALRWKRKRLHQMGWDLFAPYFSFV
jgi:hypothetical protein